jgi:hypothetical protein
MIPVAAVEIDWNVSQTSLHFPSESEIEQGFVGTRQYSAQFVLEADWEEATQVLEDERAEIARIDSLAGDAYTFDDLAREVENGDLMMDEVLGDLVAGLDLGMQAACIALCAAGCITGASCRGHVGAHAWSEWPVIIFAADQRRAPVLQALAEASDCGLISSSGRLELWARSLIEILQFAGLLISHRAQFEAMPVPLPLSRARSWING